MVSTFYALNNENHDIPERYLNNDDHFVEMVIKLANRLLEITDFLLEIRFHCGLGSIQR